MEPSTFTHFFDVLTTMSAEDVRKMAAENMFGALALCFASGILTSFTPCVYPVIPITINIFSRASQQSRSKTYFGFSPSTFLISLVYVAGMCVTYSVIGLISGLTGSLFGSILQSAWMLLALSLLFFTLFLGQIGVYSLALPASWQNKMSQVGHTRNKMGIFVMGIVSGLIISPCVGPIITGILTFVFESSNAFLGFIYFFSFSLGLGVLFLAIGGFSGVVTKLPRSGNWMKRVNYILAGLLLIATAYYGVLFLKRVGVLKSALTQATEQTSVLQWIPDEATALAKARELRAPILLDFSAEWCEACHEIDKHVFNHPSVIPHLQKMVLLRIDLTEENEKTSTIREKYKIIGLPTILVLSSDGNVLPSPKIHGFLPPQEFLDLLQPVLSR